MRRTRRAAMVGYLVSSLPLAVFGTVYLFRGEFMPYHSAAIGQSWTDLEPELQILILALMRGVGGAFLALAVTVTVVATKPFREGQRWATWLLPVVGLTVVSATLWAATDVARNTPGDPPVAIVVGTGVLLLLSFGLSLVGEGQKE